MSVYGYQSPTYYEVVIGNGKFHGWACVWAGDGSLGFRHEDGGDKMFHGGDGEDWMRRAWDQFTAMATGTA